MYSVINYIYDYLLSDEMKIWNQDKIDFKITIFFVYTLQNVHNQVCVRVALDLLLRYQYYYMVDIICTVLKIKTHNPIAHQCLLALCISQSQRNFNRVDIPHTISYFCQSCPYTTHVKINESADFNLLVLGIRIRVYMRRLRRWPYRHFFCFIKKMHSPQRQWIAEMNAILFCPNGVRITPNE